MDSGDGVLKLRNQDVVQTFFTSSIPPDGKAFADSSGLHFVLALLHPLLHRQCPTLQWHECRFLTRRTGSQCAASSNHNCFPFSSIALYASGSLGITYLSLGTKISDLYKRTIEKSGFPDAKELAKVAADSGKSE